MKSTDKRIMKYHNGIYSKNPVTGKEEWSCCIQNSKDAPVKSIGMYGIQN